jgi:hypothetical protein
VTSGQASRRSRRASAVACVAAAAVSIAFAAPRLAMAAGAGSLAVSPAIGTLDTPIDVSSDGPCPAGEDVHAVVTGAGIDPADDVITGVTEVRGLPRTTDHSLYVPLSVTLRDFFAQHHVARPLGRYTITLRCRAAMDVTSLGDFTGVVDIAANGTYSAVGTAARAVAKPDDGGLPGGAGTAAGTDGSELGTDPPVAAAPAVGQPQGGPNFVLIGVLPALLLLLGAVTVAATRSRKRADIRPDASIEQRKVYQ